MDERLVSQLERSRHLGFLGPGDVEAHIANAGSFLAALEPLDAGGSVIDLGSGGGVPGLVIALSRPDLDLVLVDAMQKRCRFLEEAVAALGLRASVVCDRAEELGRGALRGSAAAVVARSFGPPATTAECAAPLLAQGGNLIVSDPPGDAPRWAEDGLERLGLRLSHRVGSEPTVQVMVQVAPCPAEYPRRNGVPAKRPLF